MGRNPGGTPDRHRPRRPPPRAFISQPGTGGERARPRATRTGRGGKAAIVNPSSIHFQVSLRGMMQSHAINSRGEFAGPMDHPANGRKVLRLAGLVGEHATTVDRLCRGERGVDPEQVERAMRIIRTHGRKPVDGHPAAIVFELPSGGQGIAVVSALSNLTGVKGK